MQMIQATPYRKPHLAQHRHVLGTTPIAFDPLDLHIFFDSGSDDLNLRSRRLVIKLARFLKEQPHLGVRLHGHTDPRGTDEYNNVLADYRTRNVAALLLVAGVNSQRIQRRPVGASGSTAALGDLAHYAMERRVSVEIIPLSTIQ